MKIYMLFHFFYKFEHLKFLQPASGSDFICFFKIHKLQRLFIKTTKHRYGAPLSVCYFLVFTACSLYVVITRHSAASVKQMVT